MSDDLSGFEDWLLDNNRSSKTIQNAMGDMRRILRSAKIQSREDFQIWIREKRLGGMLNVTLNHYLRTINLYCLMKGWEKFHYARELRNMKIRTVNTEEEKRILSSPKGYTKERDAAVLSLIFGCGLRIGEISNVQMNDIGKDRIRVTGKGQKTRDVYLPPETRKALDEYLKIRIPSDPNYLFTGPSGRLRYDYLRQRVARVAAREGVKFSAHMGRHTWATRLLRNGVSIYAVSKLLGHSDLGTTEVYLHLQQDEAIDEVREKFNLQGGGTAHVFSVGTVNDISQTSVIPGQGKPVEEDLKATTLYNTLKKIAKEHYTVEENTIVNGARGYTAHSGEGQKIVVMKIPGEDVNVLHTLIHEMSHARLEHLYRKDLPRGLAESEAELSTYMVGAHFGFDFREDSSAYIKGWLDNAKSDGYEFGKENIDRVMNNARWLINEISSRVAS